MKLNDFLKLYIEKGLCLDVLEIALKNFKYFDIIVEKQYVQLKQYLETHYVSHIVDDKILYKLVMEYDIYPLVIRGNDFKEYLNIISLNEIDFELFNKFINYNQKNKDSIYKCEYYKDYLSKIFNKYTFYVKEIVFVNEFFNVIKKDKNIYEYYIEWLRTENFNLVHNEYINNNILFLFSKESRLFIGIDGLTSPKCFTTYLLYYNDILNVLLNNETFLSYYKTNIDNYLFCLIGEFASETSHYINFKIGWENNKIIKFLKDNFSYEILIKYFIYFIDKIKYGIDYTDDNYIKIINNYSSDYTIFLTEFIYRFFGKEFLIDVIKGITNNKFIEYLYIIDMSNLFIINEIIYEVIEKYRPDIKLYNRHGFNVYQYGLIHFFASNINLNRFHNDSGKIELEKFMEKYFKRIDNSPYDIFLDTNEIGMNISFIPFLIKGKYRHVNKINFFDSIFKKIEEKGGENYYIQDNNGMFVDDYQSMLFLK